MAYRTGEVEVLLTVDDRDLARADKNVKATGERIEKKPITAHVDADTTDAVTRMGQVEAEAKKLVSERALLKVDADIALAEKNLGRTQNRLEDLRLRADAGFEVGADIRRAEKQIDKLQKNVDGLTKLRSEIEVEADTSAAVQALQDVEAEKQIVSRETAVRVNAQVGQAERAVADLRGELDYLRSLSTTVNVEADVAAAESRLAGAEAALKDLQGARATMQVDVATDGAKEKLKDVADLAEDAGDDGGKRGGAALVGGIIAGLATIPIAGAVAKIAHTAADVLVNEFQSALQIEVRQDRLQALTGIDEASAARFARLAGEAYVNNFGESIESNMNTTRLALQFDLIDEQSTNRDTQKVIQGLAGISDVLDEDVTKSATAVSVLLGSGMVKSAEQAYDLIAAGAREGLNRNEDLLDTLTEYPSVLKRLGISGEESLGLINQGLEAGARNTDVVADALKEFQIRATDASDSSAAGFERLGLSAEEMTAKIAGGGEGAREGLQTVLDKLREIEDPVQRNAAAVELFGTKAEDLGESLFALDLSTAVEQLNGVQGAAQRMFDTLADNDASKIESAKRSIEVAAEGIKGALAGVFAEPLGDFADWVSENRGPVLQFFLDIANGALDVGESLVEGTAAGVEALGEMVGSISQVVYGLAAIPAALGDQETSDALVDLANGMLTFSETAGVTADGIRDNLGGALDHARDKVNAFAEPQVALGFLNDASLRLAGAIDGVGYSADGAKLSMEGIDLANLSASESGALLEQQILNATSALEQELAAAENAGEGQKALTDRYNTSREALIAQIEQMGIGRDAAAALVDEVLRTPASATTAFSSNAPQQQGLVQNLANRIVTLPDGSVVITANTSPADNAVASFVNRNNNRRINVIVDATGGRTYSIAGTGVQFRASGGPIFGPGGPRDDRVPVMASAGEHMWTAAEVDAVGGHEEMFRMRAAALGGLLKRANGGPVASTWRTDAPVRVTRAGGGAPVAAPTGGSAGPVQVELSPTDRRLLRQEIVNDIRISRDDIADAANTANSNTAWRAG